MSTGNGTSRRIVIVGAGPAGMAAAAILNGFGIPATLIDEAPGLGGQYYKHYSAALAVRRGRELDGLYRQGMQKVSRLHSPSLEIRTDATVLGFFEPNKLVLQVGDEVEVLEPPVTLLANGAVERIAAFPGWTLPGVVTAGGAQRLLSHEGILPGCRFVMAGTGPLLLAIATEIAEAGGDVAAVVDCTPLTAPVRSQRAALGTLRQPRRFLDWVRYRNTLRRRRIPYIHSSTVLEAIGEDAHVSAIRIAKKRADWSIVPGTEQTIEADTLCLHYGFAASIELAQVAGCALVCDEARGGWFVRHDEHMRTTRDRVYVAGQLTGIGGADLAELTGELAALSICRDLGLLSHAEYVTRSAPIRNATNRARSFADMLNLAYTPGSGIASLIRPETIICRCEDVPASKVDSALQCGATTLNDIKRHTRCGMGFCQGRICSQVLSAYAEHHAGVAPAESRVLNARFPLKPVPMRALATVTGARMTPAGSD